ncbi:MAG: class I SAM-dependent methyltransferase [Candidatus Heimdallarchaeota archaeon]|nr:class I SAM-dependent methyltransferase [Candidatus Heimdallarchaeota archaeon]
MFELYKKHHLSKEYTSIGLFRELDKKFTSERVLYPGCYVHITPSLIFPDVTYVDSFKNTNKFFEDTEVLKFIENDKEYAGKSKITFYHQDYYKNLAEPLESYDTLISQYAGFVGQAVKKYLKKGGILVCNNSHGDATMASLDDEYEFIGVYNRLSDEKFRISDKNLERYFIPKKEMEITKEILLKTQKGIGYTISPSGYIFRKV